MLDPPIDWRVDAAFHQLSGSGGKAGGGGLCGRHSHCVSLHISAFSQIQIQNQETTEWRYCRTEWRGQPVDLVEVDMHARA